MAKKSPSPNLLERTVARLDALQQRHHALALPYAVLKKYSDDEAGYQAALIAYYGFLSFFPLLIVATALLQIATDKNTRLRDQLIHNVSGYFPAIGNTLAESIHGSSRSGLALILGIVITFYGARGVADAIQHALNHVWAIPRNKRAGFPKAPLRSLGILIFGGLGLLITATVNGYAAGGQHSILTRLFLWAVSFFLLTCVLWGVFTFGSSARRHYLSTIPGAILAATCLVILQSVGVALVKHQLHNQTGINAQFAVVIAMLFWLYLQAQVVLYAIEYNVVRAYGLWPRSINPKPPVPGDERAYTLYRDRETFNVDERIRH